MPERPFHQFRPALERLEAKQPLSAGGASAPGASLEAGSDHATAPAKHAIKAETAVVPPVATNVGVVKPDYGYLVYRVSNPFQGPRNTLGLPLGQVLVQTKLPVAGQTYNILQVAVKNGTTRTFDATSSLYVQFPGDPQTFKILTGSQTWSPGQDYVFYVLSKQYYPLPSQVHSGFDFILDGARSVAIPGPSGIFLRVKYNPATFATTLDNIVQYGKGAQGGRGIPFGLPDTAIYEFVSSTVPRKDFSGYF